MNKVISITITLLVLALALVAIQQRANTKAAEERAATLEAATRAEAKASEEAFAQKESELRRAQAQLGENELRLAKLNAAATAQPAATNRITGEAKPDGPFIKDAETRALMRKQQLQQIRKQVDRFVNTNLMARLSLTAEETSSLKDLVLKKHSGHAEFMAGLMTGELEGDALRQAGRQLNEQLRTTEQEIQQFLGPERYDAFLEEEKDQEFRTGIKSLADQLKKNGHDFTGEQRDQLLATMIDERAQFPFASGFGDPMRIDFENFHDYFSDANFDRYLTDVRAFNDRVRQRAAAFLTPEQIDEIKTAQQEHLEQAKVTVKLTNALFAKRRTN